MATQKMTTAEKLAEIKAKKLELGGDWSFWPDYDAVESGLHDYWYPVVWSRSVKKKTPKPFTLCGKDMFLMRDEDGKVRALHDRCPHRGVKISLGKQWWPGTVSCPYHGWTFDLKTGEVNAVITDGPDSQVCGHAGVQVYPAEEFMGLVWVYMGVGEPHPLEEQLPKELINPPKYAMGGRIEDRKGNWRFYAENGFDEGHAKYLHRTSIWRIMKVMPTWNKIHIEQEGRWIYRIEDEKFWEADFPGLGKWTNHRWWKIKPKQTTGKTLGNVGGGKNNPYIENQNFPGFASISLPGVLRIAYPTFIHYEFYVPIDKDRTKYVGVMIQFKTGLAKWWYYLKYLFVIRPMFHGHFSSQDHWMVDNTDAPPERLYRPDISLIKWRKLFSMPHPFKKTNGQAVSKKTNK